MDHAVDPLHFIHNPLNTVFIGICGFLFTLVASESRLDLAIIALN